MEIGLLGEVTAHVDGRSLDVGPARQRCVLAALAVDAGRLVPVDRLLERVWGVDTPKRGRATLHSHISRLRRALASAEIVLRSGGYTLVADHDEVDLLRFRDLCVRARSADDQRSATLLEEALGLWRAEALTGLDGEWVEVERERLGQERATAERDLTDVLLRLGHGEDLLADLAAHEARWPLDERAAGQYLIALHRAGRTADALAHYRRLRDRLVEELGTDPGAALQDLHRRILAADRTLVTVAADPVATPRQLPAAPAPFVGRHEELDRLDTVPADASTVVISAIAGVGGVGKTWLALHWAHRRVDRFPDGQLFVDLRGFSPDSTPMDPAVALRGLLDALGVPTERIPVDPHARAALFRSLVTGKRMLLVLDNAADTAQVTPLLPGSETCTVLVTSRWRLPGLLTGHGAHYLPLDVLSDAEAHALLVDRLGPERIGAEDTAVRALIAFCGGFPLALGVVASLAGTRPGLPLADLVTELHDLGLAVLDNDDPAAGLPAVLSWSLRGLTDEQRTAFALLGIAPGPDTTLPAAAALTGLSPARTRGALQALENAFLVTRHAGGRYAMHDLVRAYAVTRDLPEPERRAALERVVDFYLHTAYAAERLLDPHGPPIDLDPPSPGVQPHPLADHQAATTWLDAEHTHVLAAQRTAAAHGRHGVVWQLAWALSNFHQRRGHRRDQLVVWEAARAASAHLPPPTRVLAHRRVGRAHIWLGRHDEAIEHLHAALALAEEHGDLQQQAHTHHELAWSWAQRGDHQRSLDHARQTLALYRTFDQPVWEALALNAIGWSAAQLGDHDTARTHCEAALALHRLHDNPNGEADTLDSLGYIAHHTGDHRQAVEHYEQALALRRTIGNTTSAADTLEHLGHPHTALGNHDQARAVRREALALFREQGREQDADRVLRQLG